MKCRKMASPSTAFLVLFLLVIGCAYAANEEPDEDDYSDLSAGITSFSGNLLNEVSKANKDKSVILSCLSVIYVLFMTSLVAKGRTEYELIRTIGVDEEQAPDQFTALTDALENLKGVTFNMANKIYVKSGENYKLDADYKNKVIDTVDSEVESIDFNQNTQAAKTINSWVEKQTNNKIHDLIKPSDLNSSTRLLLINAIYFIGTWQKPFNKNATRVRNFRVKGRRSVQIPTMIMKARLPYTEDDDLECKILKLDYVGGNVSMVIFLPNDINGIEQLKDKMKKDANDVYRAIDKLSVVEVDVRLPKFRTATEIDLKAILTELGIKQIFDRKKAKLDSMLEKPQPLYVSKLIQKAFIEVNEFGAEAAAATGAGVTTTSVRYPIKKTPTFFADHPFYYGIITNKQVELFSGVYYGNRQYI